MLSRQAAAVMRWLHAQHPATQGLGRPSRGRGTLGRLRTSLETEELTVLDLTTTIFPLTNNSQHVHFTGRRIP